MPIFTNNKFSTNAQTKLLREYTLKKVHKGHHREYIEINKVMTAKGPLKSVGSGERVFHK
jgi:superoxide dismutase